MPTFQSIPVHPSVRSRLQGDGPCENDNQPHRPRQPQNQQTPAKSVVSIPRSLLTRDLNDLVEMVSRGDIKNETQKAELSAQMENMRFQVACRMISKTRNGKRLASLDPNGKANGPKKTKQQPLVPGGSMSLLDAWKSQCAKRQNNESQPNIFSTGCSDLDNLVALPTEYYLLPNGDRDATIPFTTANYTSGEVKGIPRGYVLKLSGTSGKTQLSLQLASQVLSQTSFQSIAKANRIRYCYSTAGHSGHSLAQRLFQLVEKNVGRGEKKMLKEAAKRIEFQPIATLSQLTTTIANLEREWLLETSRNNSGRKGGKGTISMLVLDALPLMLAEREDATKIQSLEQWLKRLARQYSLIIVVATTGGDGASTSIYDNAMSPDIHLQLQKRTPTTISIQLLRHLTRPITKNDCIMYHPPTFNA